jgi:glycosyltransferase involved in cell wall biosynthesis
MSARGPVRVLQVTDTLGMGGAETWMMELLRLWARTGEVTVDFLLTSGNRGLFDDEAQRLGARLHYLPYGRRDLGAFARGLRNILHEGRFEAVHDHQDYASGWHYLLGVGALPRVRVTHVHNPWLNIAANYETSLSRRVTRIIGKKAVDALATHVCGTSSEALRRYGFAQKPGSPQEVAVLHCGFDVSTFSAPPACDRQAVLDEFDWPARAKVVLFAGRLDRALEFEHPQNHKNSWFALNVVREALKKDASVRLLMAGAGDEGRKKLQARIHDWGLEQQLRLTGVRRDMPRLMRAADVLLFPSREEGLGMVAVEAQAASLPVLASTAVPAECVVIPELYRALPLSAPVEIWADALLERAKAERPFLDFCRSAIEESSFSIQNSAQRLLSVYTATRR